MTRLYWVGKDATHDRLLLLLHDLRERADARRPFDLQPLPSLK